VLTVSAGAKEAIVRYEGVPPEHISVAHYGYDFDELRPNLSAAARASLRDAIAGDDRLLLLTVGRLAWEKGHTYLLQAAPTIIAAHPEVRFVFAGDGPWREVLEEEAHRRGVADHVVFLGFRADIGAVMEAADVVVHPTLTEAFSSVIIEALALERPLVVTDVGGAREQVDSGETGILVPPRDPQALARAVTELLGDPDRARSMGVEARRRVVARFSLTKQVALHETTYEELLQR
jgi:glycosyltransferase involved in cell wall biosynthesis